MYNNYVAFFVLQNVNYVEFLFFMRDFVIL